MSQGILTVESTHDLAETGEALTEAIVARGFGVVAVQDLGATLEKKGVTLGRGCVVYEVCNPHQAKRVLDSDMSISSVLPCRISVYEEEGRTKLSTVLPSLLLSVFERPDLKSVAEEVETVMTESMKAAAGI